MLAFHHKLAFLTSVQERFARERYDLDLKTLAYNYGGIGAMIILAGIGALLLINAYYSDPSETHYRAIAENFSEALSKNPLKSNVTGEVTLAKDATVNLAKNQHVSLDRQLDPSLAQPPQNQSAYDTKDLFQPSESQLGLNQQNTNTKAPKTTYTIFKAVPYRDGSIMTGWEFEPENTQTPSTQYCYYSGIDQGKGTLISVGRNGMPLEVQDQRLIDPSEAFRLCVWR